MTPMTNQPVGTTSGTGGVTDTARDEAGHLKDSAVDAARDVAGTAKREGVGRDVRRS
ncbi:hypothetical protein Kfla_1923 [Kribbella flavida DSM 17836]|uniref:Uncharacterized protein n=1 Tax=Kribbella flavida (strain DSM 17836 / JCM 10339 / NBRC 14399) TaxID=479435 RepID=D2PPQ5_KRIFD|nr:hypothetical protein [Kribbella flavida]ADB31017.1 hypothetical protein Kfla_1923 [Kribbella flavida DSM 17836]